MSFYKLAYRVCFFVFSLYFKIVVRGYENLEGLGVGAVLISNHVSYLDPIMLGIPFRSRRLFFMAKKELFSVPILRRIIKKLGAFPVDRGSKDVKALDVAVDIVKSGEIVAIFPQGGRRKNINACAPKTGFLRIALASNSRVIPSSVCYSGFGPRSKVYVNFGKAVSLRDVLQCEGINADLVNFKDIKFLTNKVWQEVLRLYAVK